MKTTFKISQIGIVLGVVAASTGSCAHMATQPLEAGFGPSPTLVSPKHDLVPTINVAKAVGWPSDTTPLPAVGLRVNAFARGLDHPRWLYVLPNGDVLVAETNAPTPHDEVGGFQKLTNMVKGLVMKRAGAAEPSPDRIVLLRDTNGDGTADVKTDFLTGLTSPFGMALVGNDLYVADTDALIRYPYQAGETKIIAPGTKVTALPAGPINHHWTKNLVASPDGRTLYVAVGSNSNVGENGLDVERDRARIIAYDIASGQSRPYATGLRNPVGMAWQPDSRKLWVAVNERDELGSDLVPDYLTEVHDGAFYGWPFSYYGQHVDTRVKPLDLAKIRSVISPDYALGAHTASLGLNFMPKSAGWPAAYSDGAFIGQHGSWNREPRSGYDVIFVPFANGRPSGKPQIVLDRFLNDKGQAQGRPVGVVFNQRGALLVADDVGNVVWRVVPGKYGADR